MTINIIKASLAMLVFGSVGQVANAEMSLIGNIGFTSNYIFRGVTQTGDDAAISGGIDYARKSGFYAGTWVSSTNSGAGGYEHDIYAGYGFKAGPLDMDAGYITYRYQVGNATADYDEIYVNAAIDKFTAGAALTFDTEAGGQDDNLYIYGKADFEITKNLGLTLLIGIYENDAPDDIGAEDYKHFHVSLNKDDFVFALDKNDTDLTPGGNDLRFSVSYIKSIDLMK